MYFWDLDADGFAGVVLLKKCQNPFALALHCRGDSLTIEYWRTAVASAGKSEGSWDSIHVFECNDRNRTSHYKLTSTVILHMANSGEALGEMDLSGNMTRQVCGFEACM